jgi:hypothetical protein
MVKVKLFVSRAGAGGVQLAGEVIDVSADEAKRLVEAQQGELIRSNKPERAVKRSKAEKAAK